MELPPLGLYIHLPWCERKCPYCDFNSHETHAIPERAYIDALLRDLEADRELVIDRPVETLFIGGGTPSLFSASGIQRLLRGISERIPFSPEIEATMEANPGSAEAEKFAGFRQAGVNRISLGIQSFHDAQLRALGRVHDSDQAHRALEYARDAGFDSINIDLMHGLPGHTETTALADLQSALDHQPTHLSWYQLTIEPNTVFYKRPPVLPVEDALVNIQTAGEQRLADSGYRHYEVSAWSLPGFECRHNLNYWGFGDYLGLGAGAHAKLTSPDGLITRYNKRRLPSEYLAADPANTIAASRVLNQDDIIGEFMLNTLRLHQGFTREHFERRTGLDSAILRCQLERLFDEDLLEQSGASIRPTALGRRFLDTVVGEFFTAPDLAE